MALSAPQGPLVRWDFPFCDFDNCFPFQVEPYKARGETVYKAVCKDDTKSGICPKVNRNEYAKCVMECNSGELFDNYYDLERPIPSFLCASCGELCKRES